MFFLKLLSLDQLVIQEIIIAKLIPLDTQIVDSKNLNLFQEMEI